MRYPKFLTENGKIGFIAPSFGCTLEPYDKLFISAQEMFKQKGYACVVGPNCYKDDGIGKSTNAKDCGLEINEFFTTDKSDVIISCGGGETMCEDLPYVDFKKIANSEPKWFMGYSDNTNLVFTLPTLCDTASIYAPCVGTFGAKPMHPAVNDALDLLTGKNLNVHNYPKWEICDLKTDNPYEPYNCTEDFCAKLFVGTKETNKIEISGRLLGGCLDCLQILCGTKFDNVDSFNKKYANDGIVLFIESCDLNPMGIRRALWQLRNAGWFNNAKGFLFGRAFHYADDFMGANRINAVTEILGDLDLPIIMDLDIGHLPPMMPIISGALANIKATKDKIEIEHILK